MTYHMMRVSAFVCDDCDTDFEDLGPKRVVWARAKRDGWVERDGEHFCPKCAAGG